MLNPGIVICSRPQSERLPEKVFRELNGKLVINHLLDRLAAIDVPVILAVPSKYLTVYQSKVNTKNKNVKIAPCGFEEDPLARTLSASLMFQLDPVIRITHDKIFVDTQEISNALDVFKQSQNDKTYLYSSHLTPGTGFEIISRDALRDAAKRFKNVEYISYAVRLVNGLQIINHKPQADRICFQESGRNLLIDYPEDLQLLEVILSQLGNDASVSQVLNYMRKFPELTKINRPPMITVYTCAYNAEKYIQECMHSVETQIGFNDNIEYVIVDDASTDKTCEMIARFALNHKNVFWMRNSKNKGLASSSNLAIRKARGFYVIRLDADDHFSSTSSVIDIWKFIKERNFEAVYPDNYFGSTDNIQLGKEHHHVGGAMFEKKALNFIKFTDGLRGYEGYDLFQRAQEKLRIGYYRKPIFFYRQHEESLTKECPVKREQIKQEIDQRIFANEKI